MIQVSHLIRDYEITSGLLHRKRQRKRAVDDISFSIRKGEIFSLLGPNGAGKTTTIKIRVSRITRKTGVLHKNLWHSSFYLYSLWGLLYFVYNIFIRKVKEKIEISPSKV